MLLVLAATLDRTVLSEGKPSLPQLSDPSFGQAEQTLQRILAQQKNTSQARNVILFVGDGNGFSTVTATRIFEGQARGVDGESNVLSYEAFPFFAASKTYASDAQVSDSAPTATAMLTGVKTKNDIIGLDSSATYRSCADQKSKRVMTLFEMAEVLGMSTGAVTTARITHATPAATYAHVADRDWEADSNMTPEAIQAGCLDIARQLVEMPFGDGLEVAMGGGRGNFLPLSVADPENPSQKGSRKDDRDLTKAWLQRYGGAGAFVWNKPQFEQLDPSRHEHVLGLFERSHLKFEVDRPKDAGGEPSLAEMTAKAIDILARNTRGFVLMVEGGRIDHASHAGNAYRTLSEGVAMNEAVKVALGKVDLKETLIVVTADHSHSLTINGYPKRGNPILGIAIGVDDKPILGADQMPYTTIAFANGPGAPKTPAPRPMITNEQATDPNYVQQALVPLDSETHGGEDVGIYAIGPWAHLFQGTVEQNYIFHVMSHAARIGERFSSSDRGR